MEKILVTGAGGFIGGHLVKELLNIVSEITPDAYVTTEATNPTNISSNNK